MIGAGQLARMSHRAAIDLGIRLQVLATSVDDPAVLAGASHILGAPDETGLAALARGNQVLTLDHELVPIRDLTTVASAGTPVIPSPEALRYAQDKWFARTSMRAAGFPVPDHALVENADDVADFADVHGWPVVLKAVTMGYDGRGVAVVSDRAAAVDVMSPDRRWMVEEMIDLATELAVLVVRRPAGETRIYPVVETVQEDGICRELVMPARIDGRMADAASEMACEVVAVAGSCGVTAVELFVSTTGELLVNELAMRPHNSGHATFEACVTSQFHNHLRAVLDWPLGDTALMVPAVAMVNVLGSGDAASAMASVPAALAVGGASIHLYGKGERPGRKIGHVTAVGQSVDEALATARQAAARLGGDTGGST